MPGLLAFVISLNLKRRHLTASQRSMVAEKLANMPRGGALYRTANLQTDAEIQAISQSDAARMLNVSERSVANARKVQDETPPEVARAVEAGHLTASQRAMVAEKLANMVSGHRTDLEPSANLPEVSVAVAGELANLEHGDFAGNQHLPCANLRTPQVTQPEAAQMLNVSRALASAGPWQAWLMRSTQWPPCGPSRGPIHSSCHFRHLAG